MSWNSGRRRRRCRLNNDKHGRARKVWCRAACLPRSRSKQSDCDAKVAPQLATDAIETAWRCRARFSELVNADVPSGRGSSEGIPGSLLIKQMVLSTVSPAIKDIAPQRA
jgi:hypothetical protein